MPSDLMYCPRCRRQMEKSAAAQVLSQLSAGMLMGAAKTTPCPACGTALDVETMIAGGYDRRVPTPEERAGLRRAALAFAAMGAIGLGLHLLLATGFWPTVGLTVAAAVVGALALAGIRAARAGPRARVCRHCGKAKTSRRCEGCGGT